MQLRTIQADAPAESDKPQAGPLRTASGCVRPMSAPAFVLASALASASALLDHFLSDFQTLTKQIRASLDLGRWTTPQGVGYGFLHDVVGEYLLPRRLPFSQTRGL